MTIRIHRPLTLAACCLTAATAFAQSSATAPSPSASASASATGAPRAMTIVDLINVPQISTPQISPDGSQVLYVRSDADWKANKRITHVWRAATGSRDLVQMTNGGDGEIRAALVAGRQVDRVRREALRRRSRAGLRAARVRRRSRARSPRTKRRSRRSRGAATARRCSSSPPSRRPRRKRRARRCRTTSIRTTRRRSSSTSGP